MRFLLLLSVFLMACAHRPPEALRAHPLDAVVIPGCPARPDGTLSACQWQRAVWGAELWHDGVTRAFITSGGAVQNRYIEAEGIRAGLVALGVPEDAVVLETQALHTDENAGYALQIASSLGMRRVGFASHGGQARGMRAMAKGWGHDAVALPMDLPRVIRRVHDGLPEVSTPPVPAGEWLPLDEREKLIAARLERRRRLPSWWVYTAGALAGAFQQRGAPTPPVSEPTLRGHRHRVDTRPWGDAAASAD